MLAIVGMAVAGAQGGHLVAYELRYGSMAQQMQTTGVHAYFPILVKTAFGGVALMLLAALLVIGAARVAAGGHRVRASEVPSFVAILAGLFTLQLAWFVGQEVTEAFIADVPPDSAQLLFWGMAGQLPVAVAGAIVLMWLGVRLDEAVTALGSVVPAATAIWFTAPVAVLAVRTGEQALATAHSARSPFVKRGPPSSSSFRPF